MCLNVYLYYCSSWLHFLIFSLLGLSSRYYLKNITVSQTLVPDENVNELVRESTVYFLQLNSVELAIQLTLEDYTIFRQIEPTEYIDYLFHLNSRYGTPALSQFAEVCKFLCHADYYDYIYILYGYYESCTILIV